jgi:hypothetical protein
MRNIEMATKIEQFSYADRVAALTHQYLELGLPLNSALRAAEADLWPVVKPRSTHHLSSRVRSRLWMKKSIAGLDPVTSRNYRPTN